MFVAPSSKKNDGNGDRFVSDEPFINERKLSSTKVAKGVSNNGEHTLIPVTAKMIHSSVCVIGRLKLYRTYVLSYSTYVLLVRPTKVRR